MSAAETDSEMEKCRKAKGWSGHPVLRMDVCKCVWMCACGCLCVSVREREREGEEKEGKVVGR